MPDLMQILERLTMLDAANVELSAAALFAVLFFSTFVSEDLTCLAAGGLVASGRASFALAVLACFTGIFVGDVLLYATGRYFGRSIIGRFVSENSLGKASHWLRKNGAAAVFLSRFVTGLRLPTYLAAGALKTGFQKFALYFLLASAIWTPVLVGSTAFAQKLFFPQNAFLGVVLSFIFVRIIWKFSSWKNRRLFVGRVRRLLNWEFWPVQIFYIPVVIYIAWLAIRHRSLTVFTCANPAILAGGFKGESKHDIYEGLKKTAAATGFLLPHIMLRSEFSFEKKFTAALDFINNQRLDFPLVMKPDVGERGRGVKIIQSFDELKAELKMSSSDFILQEFVAGIEASVFYYRFPGNRQGRIFSITEKRFPAVKGDGESNLEQLILRDRRAVCLAEKYLEQNRERLDSVPAAGEEIQIIAIGTHSRGAVFLDGGWLKTEKLERKIDEVCRGFDGFYFGRFDIRAASFQSLKKGENFKIIELNGVTSESTNIYDPRYTFFDAYRILFRQWQIAFEIGAANRKLGRRGAKLSDLARLSMGKKIKQMPHSGRQTARLCA